MVWTSIFIITYIVGIYYTIRWEMDVDCRAYGDDEKYDTASLMAGLLWPVGIPTTVLTIRHCFPDNYWYILTGKDTP